jgi:ribosomal protein S13
MKVFGYIHKTFKKIVMGLNLSNLVIGDKQQTTQEKVESLSSSEIEVLLSLIKRSTFLGEDLENLYNLVIKLQKQYINQTK